MNEILTLVTFLALLFYTGIEMKFQLQMLQQNSYRNDRYNRWLKGESFASVSRLTDLFLLLLLSTNFLPTFVQIVTITVVLTKSVKGLQTKYKKPLVFTKRATRLYIAALSLSLLVAGLAAGLTTLSNGSRALLAIAILAPYFMMTANIIMPTCREANQPKILRRSETNSLPNARLNCHRHYRELWKNQYQALPLPHTLRAIQRVNDSRQF